MSSLNPCLVYGGSLQDLAIWFVNQRQWCHLLGPCYYYRLSGCPVFWQVHIGGELSVVFQHRNNSTLESHTVYKPGDKLNYCDWAICLRLQLVKGRGLQTPEFTTMGGRGCLPLEPAGFSWWLDGTSSNRNVNSEDFFSSKFLKSCWFCLMVDFLNLVQHCELRLLPCLNNLATVSART